MSRITVRQPGRPRGNLVAGTGVELLLEGLDDLDPPLNMNGIIQSAFEILPDRVEIIGDKHVGAFTRVDDFVRLELQQGRLLSTRYSIYEFSGWQPK